MFHFYDKFAVYSSTLIGVLWNLEEFDEVYDLLRNVSCLSCDFAYSGMNIPKGEMM